MRKQDLENIVNRFCKKIRQLSDSIPGSFQEDAIHDLRVDYKKLRSFQRMIHPTLQKTAELGFESGIRNLYARAGEVRDLQIFLKTLGARELSIVPGAYEERLRRHLFTTKECLVEAIERSELEKTKKRIIKMLPKELAIERIRLFLSRKIAAINIILLTDMQDEDIHTIRKHIKDISNNLKIHGSEWGITFPLNAWASEEAMHHTGLALGEYNDRCISLKFFQDPYVNDLPLDEQEVLQRLKGKLLFEKEAMVPSVIEQIHRLELRSNF